MSGIHEIRARGFRTAFLGYDRSEVDSFREEMAEAVEELQLRVNDLERQLHELERAKPITADQAFANVARETQRILQVAQDAGARMLQQAREQAENELTLARREHSQIVGDGYRARDQLGDHLSQLDQARARLLRQLYDAGSEIERVCAALESDTPAATTARRAVAEQMVEHSRTGTDLSRRPVRTEPALRVVADSTVDDQRRARAVKTRPDRPNTGRGGDPHVHKRDQLAPLRNTLVEQLRDELRGFSDRLRERLRQASDEVTAVSDITIDRAALAPAVGLVHSMSGRAFVLGSRTAAVERNGLEPATRDDAEDGRLSDLLDKRIGVPVRSLLEHAEAAQDPPWAVAERVDGVISDASEAMVAEIAETELSRAYERGKLATWSEGSVAARRWLLSPHGHRRDERCRQNEKAGAVAIGDPFPSGDSVPPRVSGCTCTTSAKEETDP